MGLVFQPTRPLRGATLRVVEHFKPLADISTHAPLAGRDIYQGVI